MSAEEKNVSRKKRCRELANGCRVCHITVYALFGGENVAEIEVSVREECHLRISVFLASAKQAKN